MSEVNAVQIAGDHYQGEYQTWDFIHTMDLGYFEGNVVKYVQRHPKKAKSVDLGKGRHYVQKMRELLAEGRGPRHLLNSMKVLNTPDMFMERVNDSVDEELNKFRTANGIKTFEMEVIACIVKWQTDEDLDHIEFLIEALDRYHYPQA